MSVYFKYHSNCEQISYADLHAKWLHPRGDLLSYSSKSDYSEHFAVQLCAHELKNRKQNNDPPQIQVSHLIIHNWVDNGANHATVMAWCSQCKQPFKQHTGEQAKMLLPSCDPSFLASLTSLLVAHFWKQINVIMEYYCTSIRTTELLGNCSEVTWLVLPWEAHEQSTRQLSSTDRVATRRAAEKHSYKVKSVVYWNCTVKKICI